jgi:uncharacterized membrane protein YbhN (UPF0104 family)
VSILRKGALEMGLRRLKARLWPLGTGRREAATHQSAGEVRRSGVLLALLKLAISASAVTVVVAALDVQAALARVATQNPIGLALAAAAMLAQLALGALRWHVVRVRSGIRSSFVETFHIYYIGSFFGSYVWSGISGDVMRVWLTWRGGADREAAVHSTILDRVALIAGVAAIMLVTLPWSFVRFGFGIEGWLPCLVAAALLLGIAGLAQFDHLPPAWQRWLPLRLLGSLGGTTREVFLRPRAVMPAIAAAVMGQTAFALAAYAMAGSLGMNVTVMDCIVVMQMVALLTAVPISVGGWGVREVSMVGLFALIGVPSSSALVLSVQLGLLGLALNLPGGIFWLLLRQEPRSADPLIIAHGVSA